MGHEDHSSRRVSVIIPTYNRAKLVIEAMDSVWAQTHRPLELLVVDDGSTDETPQRVNRWIDRYGNDEHFTTHYLRQNNAGAPAARNHGLRAATSNRLKFLDSDDLLFKTAIESQLKHEVPEGQVPFGYLVAFENPTGKTNFYGDECGKAVGFDTHVSSVTSVRTTCPLYRKNYLVELGGFDESLVWSQEFDLHIRMHLSGFRFVYYPDKIYIQRNHDGKERIRTKIEAMDNPYLVLERDQKIADHINRMIPDLEDKKRLLSEVALHAWGYGRELARKGKKQEAYGYFDFSRSLRAERQVRGGDVYRHLVNMIGPWWAEKIGEMRG